MSSTCSLAAEEMDQGPNRSALGSDDVTDESTSLVEVRWSSGDESSDNQSQCLAAPQTPLINYKYRLDEFKKLFKDLPETERLIGDYPCALQRDILLQGRLYLSERWLCFYSQVFRGTKITLAFKDVVNITREKTARWIPNAVQVCTAEEKFFFTSFPARKRTYQDVFRMWQNNLVNKRLTCLEFWHMIRQHYGHELGLNHEEMESLQTPTESSMQTSPSTRTSADEVLRRLEHPSYRRLSALEHSPVDSSTPQGEDLPSPLSSHNSPSMDDYHNVPTQPVLERLGLDPPSKHSSLSLDLNANEDVSEQSGSESIEDLDEGVGLSDVQGRLYVNKMFHISANKMFELLFTDSTFMRRFMDITKIFNIGSTAWQKDSSGNTKRNLTYTVTINNPLVGKFSAVTENQTLYKESRDGHYYLVDTEVYTHDVPYHDYFYVHNRYYIIRSSKRRCRLRVYTNVKYKKQPWGLVKSFITKNSWGSIEENFRQLEAELLEEEAAMSQGGGEPGKSGLRRRRRTYSRTLPEHLKSGKQYGQESNQHRDGKIEAIEKKGPRRWNTTTIVAWMSLILLILTLMNVGLFFKLWAMEDITHRMYMRTKHRLRERAEASMIPEYGPRQAPGSTREDAQLLRTVLQDSINLLEQLRSSLLVLQQNFALANRTAAPQ